MKKKQPLDSIAQIGTSKWKFQKRKKQLTFFLFVDEKEHVPPKSFHVNPLKNDNPLD